jgi:purine-cytosine permease-like protein
MGIRLPVSARRALVAIIFGIIGLVVAFTGLKDAGTKYEDFLLVISYWIAPWLAVVFVDRMLRPFAEIDAVVEDRRYRNWAGPIAMLIGMVVSIWLFSDQSKYHGVLAKAHPGIGDITFEVGFVLAAASYLVLFRLMRPRHA